MESPPRLTEKQIPGPQPRVESPGQGLKIRSSHKNFGDTELTTGLHFENDGLHFLNEAGG